MRAKEPESLEDEPASETTEFSYLGQPVGFFLEGMPTTPGEYEYEPYRGPGHFEMVQRLRHGQPVECSIDSAATVAGGRATTFTVEQIPRSGVILVSRMNAAASSSNKS